MSRFDDLIALGLSRVSSSAGITVTLHRGDMETSGVTAVVGETITQVVESEGQKLRIRERDYLIDADDYEINASEVEPLAGDEIEQTVGGEACLFEVVTGSNGGQAWEWSDGNRTRYRIHTREIYGGG